MSPMMPQTCTIIPIMVVKIGIWLVMDQFCTFLVLVPPLLTAYLKLRTSFIFLAFLGIFYLLLNLAKIIIATLKSILLVLLLRL